jgi:hypothetical protein
MKIHIQDKVYVESDERQYTIKEYTGKTDKEGNETYKVHGYFGSLQQAVKKLIKMEIVQSEATNLKELLDDIGRIEEKINALIKH